MRIHSVRKMSPSRGRLIPAATFSEHVVKIEIANKQTVSRSESMSICRGTPSVFIFSGL